jgi:hypothetical protein
MTDRRLNARVKCRAFAHRANGKEAPEAVIAALWP